MYNTNCCQPDPCGCVDDCPIKLDFACILYNQDGKSASALDGLNLPNGTNLKLIIELLDEKIKVLNFINHSLSNLRSDYTINTLQQFAEAVDVEIGNIKTNIADIITTNNVVLTAVDSATIDFSTAGTLNHTLTGSVKIGAPESTNCLTVQSDGLVAVPQILTLNYTTKTLTISKGNTVNLSGLFSSTYLGNVASDPSGSIDGNYWYNTTSNQLKIKVNNTVKVIVTA